jgi:hypothetical protein
MTVYVHDSTTVVRFVKDDPGWFYRIMEKFLAVLYTYVGYNGRKLYDSASKRPMSGFNLRPSWYIIVYVNGHMKS